MFNQHFNHSRHSLKDIQDHSIDMVRDHYISIVVTMYARATCPHNKNNCQIALDLRGQFQWHNIYISPYNIQSINPNLLNLPIHGQHTCRKIASIYHEPFMLAHHESVPKHCCSLQKQYPYNFCRTNDVSIRYFCNIFTRIPC